MAFVTQGKTNWKFILIVVILAAIVGCGILAYQNRCLTKEEAQFPEIKLAEKTKNETAGWKAYERASGGQNFGFKYPNDWEIQIETGMGFGPEEEVLTSPNKDLYDNSTGVRTTFSEWPKKKKSEEILIQYATDNNACCSFQEVSLGENLVVFGEYEYEGNLDLNYFISNGERIIFFDAFLPSKEKAAFFETINKIVSTFKFIEPEEISIKEESCVNSGGTVKTSSCCESASDFPNLCLIGPCGCGPQNSHELKTCDCGSDECFNGTECVNLQNP